LDDNIVTVISGVTMRTVVGDGVVSRAIRLSARFMSVQEVRRIRFYGHFREAGVEVG
jgi:hypothetical protein